MPSNRELQHTLTPRELLILDLLSQEIPRKYITCMLEIPGWRLNRLIDIIYLKLDRPTEIQVVSWYLREFKKKIEYIVSTGSDDINGGGFTNEPNL